LRISRSATVPGRKRWGFLTPPAEVYSGCISDRSVNAFVTLTVVLFLACLVDSCLRGALPPVDLRAVCYHETVSKGYNQRGTSTPWYGPLVQRGSLVGTEGVDCDGREEEAAGSLGLRRALYISKVHRIQIRTRSRENKQERKSRGLALPPTLTMCDVTDNRNHNGENTIDFVPWSLKDVDTYPQVFIFREHWRRHFDSFC
jgi:hypothetical protein